MTALCWGMLNEDETDTPETHRERRRRRIEIQRVAAAALASASERTGASVASSSSGDDVAGDPNEEPNFATLSVPGRSRFMEDAMTVHMALATPEISRRMPVHFFAVYDGHGGSQVSELCKERMNVIVAEEMGRLRFARGDEEAESERERYQEEWWWRRVMKRSFARMDSEATYTSSNGIEVTFGGSTAVVAILTPQHIVVANVGDSRAVLCRRGLAVPLSTDHKPNRSDELARIETSGGRVICINEARVEGDTYLRPYVISEPEMTFTKRGAEDECLIIASDGLWDVLSSDTACKVAAECIGIGIPTSSATVDPTSGPALTATILTRLALGRRSLDNISIIVVDLKRS